MDINIGKRLKQLRKSKNLSLRALAKLAHLSHSFIADIEAGRSKPSLDTLQALARALNVSCEELLSTTEKNNCVSEYTGKQVDFDAPFREKTLADALLRLSEIIYEYNLPDDIKFLLFKEAIAKYGPPEKTKKKAAQRPNKPGTGHNDTGE